MFIFLQPRGKIEPHETPAEALVRELAEELGPVVDPAGLSPRGKMSAPAANEKGMIVEAEPFELLVREPIRPAAEIEEALRVDRDGLPAIAFAPLTGDLIIPFFRATRGKTVPRIAEGDAA